MKKIFRHRYDNHKNSDGTDKPNEVLGEFEIIEGDDDSYSYEMIGIKEGKKYKIIGQEISYLADRYNAGTKNFVELLK